MTHESDYTLFNPDNSNHLALIDCIEDYLSTNQRKLEKDIVKEVRTKLIDHPKYDKADAYTKQHIRNLLSGGGRHYLKQVRGTIQTETERHGGEPAFVYNYASGDPNYKQEYLDTGEAAYLENYILNLSHDAMHRDKDLDPLEALDQIRETILKRGEEH